MPARRDTFETYLQPYTLGSDHTLRYTDFSPSSKLVHEIALSVENMLRCIVRKSETQYAKVVFLGFYIRVKARKFLQITSLPGETIRHNSPRVDLVSPSNTQREMM